MVVVALVGSVSALVVFIYVLNVFSRRLFGDVLGWFAAPGAVLGGVLHPLAGLALAFLSVWLVSDRKTAIVMTALSVLVVAYIWAVYHVAYHFVNLFK
jgi:glucose dehydrogenase